MGPVLPPATSPRTDPGFDSAAITLTTKLQELTSGFNYSAVSLGVISIHEATPMFEFHHSPQNFDPRGVSEVNSDTVYRLASMTKLFTVLGLLRTEKVSLEDPITKYLPELRDIHKEAAAQDAIHVVDWDSITLEALAAHQSGIGADYSLGFISVNATDWAVELGVEAPTGAIYSTTSDLMAFGKAILSYEMLSPIRTRKWMKPLASTSSISTLIGAPWEVYRSNKVTKDGRLVEFYTKAGDLFTYHSVIALIPDYDLVMVALMSGPEVSGDTTYQVIGDAATALLPVIEQAGKAKAKTQYAGTYADSSTNSILTLSLDDSPGFNVTKWQVRGVDVIGTFLLGDPPAVPPQVRLYPSDLSTSSQTAWRAVFGGSADDVAAENVLYPWDQFSCSSWASLDKLVYQFQGQDLFVFDMIEEEGGDARASSINLPAYQVKLARVAE
ncbi:hypothetical protein ACHAPE_010522 [Trichoderma viride]